MVGKVTSSDICFGEGIGINASSTFSLRQNTPYFIFADNGVFGWVSCILASNGTAYWGWFKNENNAISISSSKGNVITVTNNASFVVYVGLFKIRL